jgi:nitroimidazol reductase NimA-like FMN-containing flavoprotein (pyridoxamine 5'-phosphate oxidase superfamily)
MLSPTPRTTLRRHPERAAGEMDTVRAILDEGLVCHLGFVTDAGPMVIPTAYARAGDVLYVHGALAGRAMRTLAAGGEICLTVTLLDGLVLAAGWFGHSMNYRSVVVLGRPREVTDPAEKLEALRAIVEHIVPGRTADARPPTPAEVGATTVIALDLREVSAKVRSGPPMDAEADQRLDVWTGVVPLRLVPEAPVASPVNHVEETPDYARDYRRPDLTAAGAEPLNQQMSSWSAGAA